MKSTALEVVSFPETKPEETAEGTQPLAEVQWQPETDHIVRNVLTWAVAVEIVLVFLDATVNFSGWIPIGPLRRLCNIAREDSLAAWLASAQTLFTGLILGGIWLQSRAFRQNKRQVRGWGLLTIIFLYLAVDDGAGFHERVGSTFDELNKIWSLTSFFPTYSWHLVLGPLFASMGLFILTFLWRALPTRKERISVLCALSCYALAVAFDFLEGIHADHVGYGAVAAASEFSEKNITHFGKVTEEFLELLGTTFFMITFLRKLLNGWKTVIFHSSSRPQN